MYMYVQVQINKFKGKIENIGLSVSFNICFG